MATSQLTERQQQVKELSDKGRSTKQIAKALKITENGVYQHMRRIRAIEGERAHSSARKPVTQAARTAAAKAAKAKSLKSGGTTANARKPAAKPAAKRTTPVAPKAEAPRLATNLSPLEAIELRKAEITDELRETQTALDETRAAYENAVGAHDAAAQAHAEELRNLDLAERAIKGEIKRPTANKRKAPAATNGASEATPAPAPAPEPAPEPAAPVPAPAEPVAAVAQTPVPVAADAGYERPGVPSDPDFEQGGDPFGGDAE